MNKWIKIILALAVIGAIAAFLVFKFYINKPHADIEKAEAAYTLDAAALWKEYNNDMKLADSLYTGQVIEVTGKLDRCDSSDSLLFAVFVMEADSMFGDKSIRCELLPKYHAEAKTIAAGTEVKVKGFCNGFDMTDIKFSKSSFVK